MFGEVADEEIRLNKVGRIVEGCWRQIPIHFDDVQLDEWVVMPNHIHGIIVVGARHAVPFPNVAPPEERFPNPVVGSLPTIVRSFKSAVTKSVNEQRGTPRLPVWQRNYFEHVIRNDESLDRIREYIVNNPSQWEMDRENPIGARHAVPLPNTPQPEPWRV